MTAGGHGARKQDSVGIQEKHVEQGDQETGERWQRQIEVL